MKNKKIKTEEKPFGEFFPIEKPQAPKPKTVVLIPVLSKLENDIEFLKAACSDADEVSVLCVVDRKDMVGKFGFAATEIAALSGIADQIKTTLEEKGKTVEILEEWGETGHKISQTAELKQVQKIVLVKQQNQHYEKLKQKISEQTSRRIQEIKVIPKIEETATEPKKGLLNTGFLGIKRL